MSKQANIGHNLLIPENIYNWHANHIAMEFVHVINKTQSMHAGIKFVERYYLLIEIVLHTTYHNAGCRIVI
jgi:hypothetical protein